MLNVIPNETRGSFDDVISANSVVQGSNKHGNGDESGSEVWDSDYNHVALYCEAKQTG